MKLHCPHCGVKGSADDSYLGRKVKCPKCQGVFEVVGDSSVQPSEDAVDLGTTASTPEKSSTLIKEDPPPATQDKDADKNEPVAALSTESAEEVIDFEDDTVESEPSISPPTEETATVEESLDWDDIVSEIDARLAEGEEPGAEPAEIPEGSPVDVSSLRDDFDQSTADETVPPAIAAVAGNHDKEAAEDPARLVDEKNDGKVEPDGVDNSAKTADAAYIPGAGAGDAGLRDTGFTIGSALREAWENTKGAKGTIWAGSGIMYLVLMVIAAIGYFLAPPATGDPADMTGGLGYTLLQCLTSIISILFTAGLIYMGIRKVAGDQINWQMIFQGFSTVGKVIVATVLQTILVVIGFMLLVLPGIYLAIGYAMTIPLIVDRGMGPWQAMEMSRKAIHKVWWKVAALFIIMALLYLIALIPLGLGLIWIWPMFIILFGVIYHHLFGAEEKTE